MDLDVTKRVGGRLEVEVNIKKYLGEEYDGVTYFPHGQKVDCGGANVRRYIQREQVNSRKQPVKFLVGFF